MELTVKSQKILKYIYRHNKSGVSRKKLINKFHCSYEHNEIDKLTNTGYISHDYIFPTDSSGFHIGNVPDTALYSLNESGICEVESHRYLTIENIIRDLIVPIIVGVSSAVITSFILN
jgi:hypothetical protein